MGWPGVCRADPPSEEGSDDPEDLAERLEDVNWREEQQEVHVEPDGDEEPGEARAVRRRVGDARQGA